jgi:hypothetical protein
MTTTEMNRREHWPGRAALVTLYVGAGQTVGVATIVWGGKTPTIETVADAAIGALIAILVAWLAVKALVIALRTEGRMILRMYGRALIRFGSVLRWLLAWNTAQLMVVAARLRERAGADDGAERPAL